MLGPTILNPSYDTGECRSRIPEDDVRDLFLQLYNTLVWATPDKRRSAVRALIAAYNL